MKNKLFALLVLLASLCALFPACSGNDDELISFGGLPDPARQFILAFFHGEEPYFIGQEGKGSGRHYEVVMTGGYEIRFDSDGNWTEVEAPDDDALPNTSFIPTPILSYVEASYPLRGINSISRDRRGYEVELTFGPDLCFDPQGRFLRADD